MDSVSDKPSLHAEVERLIGSVTATDNVTPSTMALLNRCSQIIKGFEEQPWQRPPVESMRGECHDAAERDQGCFRALKAERETKEAEDKLVIEKSYAKGLAERLSATLPKFTARERALVRQAIGLALSDEIQSEKPGDREALESAQEKL